MAQSRPEPPPPKPRSEIDPKVGAPERYGPVAIACHVKDDGRALILYTRVEQPPPA